MFPSVPPELPTLRRRVSCPLLLSLSTLLLLTLVSADASAEPDESAESSSEVDRTGGADEVEAVIDAEESSIRFTSTAPAERIVGSANELSGRVHFSPDAPESARAEIRFPVASMRTGNNLRDRHLRGSDWLHADEHPEIVFTMTSIDIESQARDGDRVDLEGTAQGTLRMRGVEREVSAPVEVAVLTGASRLRVRFEMEANIVDHEVPGRRNSIGREVAEVITVEGTVYGNWD